MSPRVKIGSTGANAEARESVAIRRNHATKVVGITLGTDKGRPALPDLEAGDVIRVSVELELTTDCERQQGDCVGAPYGFEPEIESQLLLAADPTATAPAAGAAIALTAPRRESISHAHHHLVLVYDNARYRIRAGDLAWSGPSYINLVLSARHAAARAGNVLLIGENDPGGAVGGDRAGLSVVRTRAGRPQATVLQARTRRAQTIPVIKGEVRVIYSCPITDLREGAQLAVRGRVKTSTAHLSYPARVSLRVLLGDTADDTKPGPTAKTLVVSPDISRLNGTNRLPDERRGGTSTKLGVLRATEDAPGPVFVNVVLTTGDPLQQAAAGDVMRILGGGGLEIAAYPPELDG